MALIHDWCTYRVNWHLLVHFGNLKTILTSHTNCKFWGPLNHFHVQYFAKKPTEQRKVISFILRAYCTGRIQVKISKDSKGKVQETSRHGTSSCPPSVRVQVALISSRNDGWQWSTANQENSSELWWAELLLGLNHMDTIVHQPDWP